MAKPRLIILIRHAQSEGNRNRDIHQTVPDHRVKLTQEGWSQAYDAGHRLRKLLRPDDTLQFFTSPYRRTRETTEGILDTLTSDEPGPSPFRRSSIKVYEEPRLREQDFGNFQPCSDEMERMWQERADYGHFFYRIPNGESAADAYDRISGFNESLWRQFGEDDFPSVCVLVTHGLMSRVFLMKWYHFTVEYFEDLRNVNHCEFLIMRKQDNGKYFLENNLRTWSDLRRERALKEAAKDKDRDPKDVVLPPPGPQPNPPKPVRQRTLPVARRWGGCPNGCDHSRHYIKKRDDLEVLRQRDTEHAAAAVQAGLPYRTTTTTTTTIASWQQQTISSDEAEDDHPHPPERSGIVHTITVPYDHQEPLTSPDLPDRTPSSSEFDPDRHDDSLLAADAGISSKFSNLHVGRDFGGTYSGHASTVGSDTDASEDEHTHQHHHHAAHRPAPHGRMASLNTRIRIANAEALAGRLETAAADKAKCDDASSTAGVMRLGDMSTHCDTDEEEDLNKAEKEDRSISGSVY